MIRAELRLMLTAGTLIAAALFTACNGDDEPPADGATSSPTASTTGTATASPVAGRTSTPGPTSTSEPAGTPSATGTPEPTATLTPTPAVTQTPGPGQVVRLKGVFVSGFEQSAFHVDSRCPGLDAGAWLAWGSDLDFGAEIERLSGTAPFAAIEPVAFRVELEGELSAEGQFGHLGQYARELIVTSVTAAEVAGDCDDDARGQAMSARARWQQAAITDYIMRFSRACECMREWAGPFDVTVRGGALESAVITWDESIDPPPGAVITIDEMFTLIDHAIRDGQQIANEYDPADGHPLELRLDVPALAVDGGLSLTVHAFEALK